MPFERRSPADDSTLRERGSGFHSRATRRAPPAVRLDGERRCATCICLCSAVYAMNDPTVLIIDDDEDLGVVIEEVLAGEGYQVRRAPPLRHRLPAPHPHQPPLVP